MSIILSLAVIHFLAVMSPGPDFVVAVKNSLQSGRVSGVFTALGFAVGCLVHITYCLLGIAILISQSILIFSIIKILGALYLIYLAYKALKAKKSDYQNIDNLDSEKTTLSIFESFKSGFITNLLNPKATLYFLGVFTLMITPETPFSIVVGASVAIFLITFFWFSFIALALTVSHVRKKFVKFSYVIDKVLGFLLLGFGIKVLFAAK